MLALIAPAGLEELLSVAADPTVDPDDRAALLAVGGVQAAARGMTERSTRIVLVDDHVLVRSGMKALLDAAARPRGDGRGRRRRGGRRTGARNAVPTSS